MGIVGLGGGKELCQLHLVAGVIQSAEAVIGFGQIRTTPMPLTSVVWPMRASCSWGIKPLASEDTQDRPEGLQRPGWGTAVGTMVAPGCSGLLFWGGPCTELGRLASTEDSEGQDKLVTHRLIFQNIVT